MTPYESKRAERVARARAKAARLRASADAGHASVRAKLDAMAGTPILVGHHSERRHRRDLARVDATIRRSVEAVAKAAALEARADRIEASTVISSDDPEALDKLRKKRGCLVADLSRMKAVNRAVRSKSPREALEALGLDARAIALALQPDESGHLGVPDYAIRNTASAIRRVDVRLAELEAKAAAPAPDALEVPGANVVQTENRVRVFFGERPSETVRLVLRREGFRWAPSVEAWQRLASPLAWAAAKRVVKAAAFLRGDRAEESTA